MDNISVPYDKKYTKKMDEFQSKLFEIYEMRNLKKIEWFLGIRVIRDRFNFFYGFVKILTLTNLPLSSIFSQTNVILVCFFLLKLFKKL